MSGQKNAILHVDETGSVIRKPQDCDSKHIFYVTKMIIANPKIEKRKNTHIAKNRITEKCRC